MTDRRDILLSSRAKLYGRKKSDKTETHRLVRARLKEDTKQEIKNESGVSQQHLSAL